MNFNNSDNDIIITGTAQADKVENYGSKVSIDGGAGDDDITNGAFNNDDCTWNNVSINGGAGNDTIYNTGKYALVNGGDGNDSINNWSGKIDDSSYSTLNGNDGEDNILNGSHHIAIDGGADNDVVENFGNDVTIKGGTGDDFIKNNNAQNVLFTYREGDGNDYIVGFAETSTLQIIGESVTYSTQKSGSNVVVTVGEGSITLLDAANLSTVHIETKESEIEQGLYIENHDNNKFVTGNAGDDSIKNDGSNVTIAGGGGDDSIQNHAENVLFIWNESDGNDTLEGFGETSTLQIDGGTGAYSTQLSGDDLIVKVGNGSVLLKGAASLSAVNIDGVNPLIIVGTESSDEITKNIAGVTIKALGGNDSVTNYGSNVLIDGGHGVDTIQNFGVNAVVYGGLDDDSLYNFGENTTVDGGQGSDTFQNYGVNVLIDGGLDNDSINNNGFYGTLNGGQGSDTINNWGLHVIINGGDGDDSIHNNSEQDTINGDAGSDAIENFGAHVLVYGGLDNDSINNNGFYATLDGGQGFDSVKNYGHYALISGGENRDTIQSYGDSSIIDGGADNDSIYNRGNYSTVNGGTGNDTIDNFGANTTVDGGQGSDYLQNSGASVSIGGGDGNDTITNGNENNISIDGGAGDDVVEFYGIQGDYIVRGGKGNDTVYLRSDFNNIRYAFEYIYEYAPGDGDDVVTTNAIISLLDGATVDEITVEGNDVILKIGDGSIRIKDGANPGDVPIINSDDLLSDDNIQQAFEYTYAHTTDDFAGATVMGNLLDEATVDEITTDGNDVIFKVGDGSVKIQNGVNIDGVVPTINADDFLNDDDIRYAFEYTYNHTPGVDVANSNVIGNLLNASNIGNIMTIGNDVSFNVGNVGRIKIQNGVNLLGASTGNVDNILSALKGNQCAFEYTYNHTPGVLSDAFNKNALNGLLAGASFDKITVAKNDVSFNVGNVGSVKIQNGVNIEGVPTIGIDKILNSLKGNQCAFEYTYNHASGVLSDAFNKNAIGNLSVGATVDQFTVTNHDAFVKMGAASVKLKDYFSEINFPTITPKDYDYYRGYDEITNDTAGQSIDVFSQVRRNTKVQNTGNNSTLVGGKGNNRFINTGANVAIIAQQGNNYIENHSGNCSIKTGKGADMIMLPTANNSGGHVESGDGPDHIYNNGANGYIECGNNNDYYGGCPTSENSTAKGGLGNDTLETEGNSNLDGGPDNDVLANGDKYDPELAEKRKQALEEYKEFLRENLKASFDELKNNDVLMDIVRNGMDSEYLQGDGSGFSEKAKNELVALVKAQYEFLRDADNNLANDLKNVIQEGQVIAGLMDEWEQKLLAEESSAYYQERQRLQLKKQFFDAAPGLENRFPKVKEYLANGGSFEDLFVPDINKYPALSKYTFDETASALRQAGNSALSETFNVIDAADTAKKISRVNEIAFDDNLSSQDKYVMGTMATYDVIGAGAGFIATGLIGVAGALGAFATAPVWVPVALGICAGVAIGGVVAFAKHNFINKVNSSAKNVSYDADNSFVTTEGNIIFTLSGGQDKDVLVNDNRTFILMDGGDDNDTIDNYNSSQVTIDGGTGNDVIGNLNSTYVTIDGGAGDDTIGNQESDNVLINTGNGNNSVTNCEGSDVTILTGNGNNYIDNVADKVSIQTGNGSDSIVNMGDNVTIRSGGDADIVWSMGDRVSIQTGDGNDSVKSFGNRTVIDLGNGDNSIHAEGENFSVTAGDGNNSIETNFNSYMVIRTGKGDDYFLNGGSNVTIDTGDGKNIINNIGDFNFISGGKNEDYLENIGDNNSIDLGDGEDFLELIGNSNSVSSGTGDDLILICEGTLNTIAGDKGDDLIINGTFADYNLFKYCEGDGFDTISGFNENSTLQIGDGTGTYSTQVSDSDIVVTVGEDSITLDGAASLEKVNIQGNKVSASGAWSLCDSQATYNVDGKILITVTGVKSLDGISLVDNVVILSESALGTEKITLGGQGYKLALASDVPTSSTQTAAVWTHNGNSCTYKNKANAAYYTLKDNEISYTPAHGGNELFTLTNVKDTDSIAVDETAKTVTLKNDNLTGDNVTLLGDYTLKLDGVVEPQTAAAHFDGLIYKSASNTAGYSLDKDKKSVTYTTANPSTELFALSGVSDTHDVSVNDKTVIVGKNALNGSTVELTTDNGYSLALSGEVTQPAEIKSSWKFDNGKFTYKAAGTTAGYILDGDKIIYAEQVGGEQFTITGVKDTKNISVDGNVVTVGKGSLNGKTVELTGNYTLALADDVAQSAEDTIGSFTNFANGTATFTTSASGDFYTLDGNKITYTKAVTGKTITIKGLKKDLKLVGGTLEGITVERSNGVITFKINSSVLTTGDVTLTGENCKLALDDYTRPESTDASFVGGVYTAASTPAFYSEAIDKKISYTKATGGEQFTVTGLANEATVGNGITISGKTVKISSDALNGQNVTLTTKDGFKLAIDKSVPTAATKVKAAWSNDGDAYTYTTASTSGFYKLSGNKINYTKATGGQQFTVTGIKSKSGITISGKKVTIGKSALDAQNVIFSSDDFTLALDKKIPSVKSIKSGWKGKNGKFTYTAAGTTAGYILDGDKIIYAEQVGGEQFTITGVKDTKNISVEGNIVTVGKGSLNGKTVEVTGNYTLALADDVAQPAEEIDGRFTSFAKGTATFTTSSYSNDFYSLDGNKIIYTPKGGKKIKIAALNPKATMSELQNSVNISESNGSFNVTFVNRDALNGKAPTITAPKGITCTIAVDDSLKVAAPTLGWKVSGTNATLRADTDATYNVAKNKIKCTKAKIGSPQVVLTGLAKNASLADAQDKVITLNAETLGTKTSVKSNAGGYSFNLTGDMTGKTFSGSKGADTIVVAADNSTIQGGKGNDKFTLTKDATLIYALGDGNDSVNFAEGFQVSLSGSTAVKGITKNNSSVIIDCGKNSSITVADFSDDDSFEIVGKKQNITVDMSKFDITDSLTFDKTKSPTAVTIAADFTGSITQDDDLFLGGAKLSNVATFDASNVNGDISVEGNAKANKVYGSAGNNTLDGGSGNDKLWGSAGDDILIGGKGNDTLWGDEDNDTFIYKPGDGKDVICDFSDNDLLQITGTFSGTYNSSRKEISFKVGSTANAIVLRDFSATNFNINGDSYTISGKKLIKT